MRSDPWLVVVILLIAMGVLLPGAVARCDAELVTVAEPEGWRQWPAERDLGGYTIHGRRMMVKYDLGLEDTELRDAGLCPRGGVSLDGWFVRGPGAPYLRQKDELRLRIKNGTTVVSGSYHDLGNVVATPATEMFLVAFRRDVGPRLAFTGAPAKWAFTFLSAMFLCAAAGISGLLRARREARSFSDVRTYKPGVRDSAGVITFDDGSPPVLPERGSATRCVPGPVLVRVDAVRIGNYRSAPSTRANLVLVGDAATNAAAVTAHAASRWRSAVNAGLAILGGGVLLGACAALSEASRNFY